MTLDDAEALARRLMKRHGLIRDGWQFEFFNSMRTIGRCDWRYFVIRLSADFVVVNDAAVIKDTILHEIAHALTPGAGHGPEWQDMALDIGAIPRACKNTGVTPPPYRFIGRCPGCQQISGHYARDSRLACRDCEKFLTWQVTGHTRVSIPDKRQLDLFDFDTRQSDLFE